MGFEFGVAAELYARGEHPRLLFGPEDLPRLRRALRRGHGPRLMAALRARVRPHVRAVEAVDDLRGEIVPSAGRPAPRLGGVLQNLPEIALVGVLDRDGRALEAVRRMLLAIPEAETRAAVDRLSLRYSSCGLVQIPYDLAYGALSVDERRRCSDWLVRHAIRETLAVLRKMHFMRSAGMNIPMDGLITALLSLLAVKGDAGVPDLAGEECELLRYLEACLACAIGPNGFPEEDIGYGTSMTGLLAPVIEAARRAGLYDAYADSPWFSRFGEAILHFVQPWGGFLSNTGDYTADFGVRSLVLPRLAAETGSPALMWLNGTLRYPIGAAGPMDIKAAQKAMPEAVLAPGFRVPADLGSAITLPDWPKPVHPSRTRIPTQFMDPGRGIVTFRSSWKDDATFVVFDGSHRSGAAPGHAHDSGGHFSLSALGEYFAIDTGRYNIEQDQHNVVLVDGRSGVSTKGEWRMTRYQAQLTGYRPSAFVDTAAVTNSQMADCYWSKRTLGLVKDPSGSGMPAYVWTVEDVNKDNDYHEFWWALNMHPDHRVRLHRRRAEITGCDRGSKLDVHFALPPPDVYPRPHTLTFARDFQCYGSYAYTMSESNDPAELADQYRRLTGHLEYGPVFKRPRLLGKVAGYNGRFMALMIPRRKGEAPAEVEQLRGYDNVLAVRVRAGGVEDILVWAYEHQVLEVLPVPGVPAIVGRGRWCVVRRSRRTGRILAWDIDGRRLAVNGKRLL